MTDNCAETTRRSVWDFSEETPSFQEQLLERLLAANTVPSQQIGKQEGRGVLPGS